MRTDYSRRRMVLSLLPAAMIVAMSGIPVFAAPPCKPVAVINPASQTVQEVDAKGVPTVVTLDGSQSMGKQGTLTYSWNQKRGGKVDLSSPTSAITTFTAPEVNQNGISLDFELTVSGIGVGCTDPKADTATTTVTVTNVVRATNLPPVAAASASLNPVNEGTTVRLEGAGSSDPDPGDVLAYNWTQLTGTAVILTQVAGSTTGAVEFTAPNVGTAGETLTFRLTVIDKGGLSSSADVAVTVRWVNDPPIAEIVCPAESFNEGTKVNLTGGGSKDEDVSTLTYFWTVSLGPPVVDLSAISSSPDIEFNAPQLGYQQDGKIPFKLTVTDSGNLSSFAECTIQINDVTAPVITGAVDTIAEATSAAGAVVEFLPTAEDAHDGSVDVACTPASGSTFPLGITPVSCAASDKAGNKAEATFKVTVQDTIPPVVTPPANVTKEATGPRTFVSYGTATATDAVGVSSLSNDAPADFPVGTTTIKWSASDAAGNIGTATSTVTVVDTTPPVVTPPANVTKEATGPRTVAIYGKASATDAVGVVSESNDAPADFPVGTTTITWSARDAAGNLGTATSTVTVVDTTPPVVTPPANVTVIATGLATAVALGTATATDAVGVVSLTSDAPATFPIGKTTVTWTAKDAAGNVGTATCTVWVQYVFAGFFQPIDNIPVVNAVRAGSAIPVKFSVGVNPATSGGLLATGTQFSYAGWDIIAAGYPRSGAVLTSDFNVQIISDAETVTAGASSLTYDSIANQYVYVWKTDKAWAGGGRQLQIMLKDGTTHTANFKFSR